VWTPESGVVALQYGVGAERETPGHAIMASMDRARRTAAYLAAAITLGILASATPVAAEATKADDDVRFAQYDGYESPGTPAKYDKVGVIETGPEDAKNVLVLVPGTSASAAYFEPIAEDIVAENKGWQVWAVERRENLLEDHSVLNEVKAGKATPRELFEYYLGFVTDPTISPHFEFIPDSDVAYAKEWGMKVAVEDLHRVVEAAKKKGGEVVLGGHSLGGSIATAYATWDFGGKPGAKDLSGLVYIDGGSGPTPVTPEAATQSLQALESGSPWLTFGGITAPYTGLFNLVGSTTVHEQPNEPSLLQTWPVLPANLKPPVPTTSVASYGFALDVKTSPPGLAAAQAHLGELAASGDPRGWDRAGALTPIQRYADMFSGTGLESHDGTAWYHPQRLTIDSGAVAAGNANPTQAMLDVEATHGRDLPKSLRIYAFGASLGGTRVLDAARLLAEQSAIPSSHLTLVDRHDTYSHNDPSSAAPKNDFLQNLTPFLHKIAA
jgi:pimeloyl-ACP methyl ester carboxylesterase